MADAQNAAGAPVEEQPAPQQAPLRGQTTVVPNEAPGAERHTIPPELPNAGIHMADWEQVSRNPEKPTPSHCTCRPPYNTTCDYCMSLEDSFSPNFVPPMSEEDSISAHGLGIMAKLARGGWKRISMSTVQSDDDRFTITIIDPTRRGKWFLLKDLQTGESYEERTMTEAKKKSLDIRGDSSEVIDDPRHDPLDGHCYEGCPCLDTEGIDIRKTYEYLSEGNYLPEDIRRRLEANYPKDLVDEFLTNLKTPNRTANFAVEETMATPIKGTKEANQANQWARLRQVATEQPKEADAAIAELADALGIMADSLNNLRTNLDLVETPKTASIKTRIQAARKYAATFRQMANETPEVVADALSEVYHSLDDVAGAVETLAENLGIDLNLSPVEEEFDAESDHTPEEPTVDEGEFEEGEKELESPEAEPAEEKLDEEIDKEAGATEWTTDRDEQGDPKSPVLAAAKECTQCSAGHEDPKKPGFCKRHGKKILKAKKKADGGAGFVTDRDNNAKPEAPAKTEAPEAQGKTEVGKAASILERRKLTRQRIAKRHGIEL